MLYLCLVQKLGVHDHHNVPNLDTTVMSLEYFAEQKDVDGTVVEVRELEMAVASLLGCGPDFRFRSHDTRQDP